MDEQENPQTDVELQGYARTPLRTRAPRRRRQRVWFGWLGFPSRADAAQHLRMIGRHFLSLIGWRA